MQISFNGAGFAMYAAKKPAAVTAEANRAGDIMKIIVAPDSYKGSVSATKVADAIERGIKSVFPTAEVIKVPVADGGEGTAEALVAGAGGRILSTCVMGPLGNMIEAKWGILGDGKTAVIEMAAASGLTLVSEDDRNPRAATTFGTGQLIKAALDCGLRKIIIGLGGSATNDGGSGMAMALGARLAGSDGKDIALGGGALASLAEIGLQDLDKRLRETKILAACDVTNPLCGPSGATAVYGPQKGATPAMIAELDAALSHYAAIAAGVTGRAVAELPGAGAAGGLGAGLMFFTDAQLMPGVELVLETTGFSRLLQGADLVITGEGRTDYQTVFGKAPVGVAGVARRAGVPVVCLSGSLGEGADEVLSQGIGALMSIVPGPVALAECMQKGEQFIEEAAARLGRLLIIGGKLGR